MPLNYTIKKYSNAKILHIYKNYDKNRSEFLKIKHASTI